jgi:hypothetical protein
MLDLDRCFSRGRRVAVGSVAVGAALLLSGPARADAGPGFLTIASSGQSGVTSAQTAVVRDGAAWAQLWARHAATQSPPPARPEVDFSRFMVLAVFAGGKPSACYGVQVTGVVPVGANGVQLRWREPEPPAGMMCASVMTFPAQFVQVPRVNGKVSFSKQP